MAISSCGGFCKQKHVPSVASPMKRTSSPQFVQGRCGVLSTARQARATRSPGDPSEVEGSLGRRDVVLGLGMLIVALVPDGGTLVKL